MKLPFIHRDSYDWAIRQLGQRDQRVRELEETNTELLHQIILLKRDGFAVTHDPNEVLPRPPSVDETDDERAKEEMQHG